ncbi:MAG: sugar ABC transporter permease, partial [Burkholderiales bacterium]|nr:sugar ABC transporter permease [Anaerolineae bacterium]
MSAETIDSIATPPKISTAKPARWQAKSWFPMFLIAPSIVLILFVVVFPLIYSFYVSFTPYTLLKP